MEYLQYKIKIGIELEWEFGFKPYYKWNTFNTYGFSSFRVATRVLNLIINGIPSILGFGTVLLVLFVLF